MIVVPVAAGLFLGSALPSALSGNGDAAFNAAAETAAVGVVGGWCRGGGNVTSWITRIPSGLEACNVVGGHAGKGRGPPALGQREGVVKMRSLNKVSWMCSYPTSIVR